MNGSLLNILKSFFYIFLFSVIGCPSTTYQEERVKPIKKKTIKPQVSKQFEDRESRMKRLIFRIDSINNELNWKKLSCGLYLNKNNELGFQMNFATEVGSTVKYTTELVSNNEAQYLISTIDTTTFKHLGSTFYKDKNNIYHYFDMAYGGNFYIYDNVDHATFKVIGDHYAKDKNHIYGERAGVLKNVDYKTFRTAKNIGPYAKDKNEYYFWDDLITTEDLDIIKDSMLVATIKKLDKIK